MIGAVAGFKQQNAASGLPLRLLPEELGLALDRGWVRGYRLRGERREESEIEGEKDRGTKKTGTAKIGAADPFLGDAKGGEEEGNGEATGSGKGDGGGGSEEERKEGNPCSSSSPSLWREALAQGTHLSLATAAPESLRVYFDSSSDENPLERPRANSPAAASHSVLRDLHSRGYCLTPGANFGAHWLAYPSDPMLYHAQLCVRVCSGGGAGEGSSGEGEEGGGGGGGEEEEKGSKNYLASSTPLCPTLLAAASRGAHAARKHLLLAYPNGGGWREERVHYLTMAPEAGFGS